MSDEEFSPSCPACKNADFVPVILEPCFHVQGCSGCQSAILQQQNGSNVLCSNCHQEGTLSKSNFLDFYSPPETPLPDDVDVKCVFFCYMCKSYIRTAFYENHVPLCVVKNLESLSEMYPNGLPLDLISNNNNEVAIKDVDDMVEEIKKVLENIHADCMKHIRSVINTRKESVSSAQQAFENLHQLLSTKYENLEKTHMEIFRDWQKFSKNVEFLLSEKSCIKVNREPASHASELLKLTLCTDNFFSKSKSTKPVSTNFSKEVWDQLKQQVIDGKLNAIDSTALSIRSPITGESLLHVAAQHDQGAVAVSLVNAGIDVSVCDSELNNALHLAYKSGHSDLAYYLEEMVPTSLLSCVNNEGKTPRELFTLSTESCQDFLMSE